MQVGSDQYWRCVIGMGIASDKMLAAGYNLPENGERLWCGKCLAWVTQGVKQCPDCGTEVFTPNEVREYVDAQR